jgi:hypothetical protein
MRRMGLLGLMLATIPAAATVSATCDIGMSHRKLTTVGTVVAYDQPVSGLAMLTSVPMEQILIVRLDRSINRKQESKYIKLSFRRWFNEPELPSGILNSKNKWRFSLTRDINCDGSTRELQSDRSRTEEGKGVVLQRLRRTSGAEKEEVPDALILPCYVLRPGGLRRIR